MRILITGVGNVGKSTLREKAAAGFGGEVVQIDMDYFRGPLPPGDGKIVLVEDVHGLEKSPGEHDFVLYLKPMRGHLGRWLKRGRAWFATGVVDLADRGGNGRPYSLTNIPSILKIILRNLLYYRRWVRDDLRTRKEKFPGRFFVTDGIEDGKRVLLDVMEAAAKTGN